MNGDAIVCIFEVKGIQLTSIAQVKECHRVLLQQGDTSKKLEISFKKPTCMNKEQAKFLDIHSTYSMEGNL